MLKCSVFQSCRPLAPLLCCFVVEVVVIKVPASASESITASASYQQQYQLSSAPSSAAATAIEEAVSGPIKVPFPCCAVSLSSSCLLLSRCHFPATPLVACSRMPTVMHSHVELRPQHRPIPQLFGQPSKINRVGGVSARAGGRRGCFRVRR